MTAIDSPLFRSDLLQNVESIGFATSRPVVQNSVCEFSPSGSL